MKLIGLTGGIASGKSAVRQMLAEAGAEVLDADAIYHELIAPDAGGPSQLAQQVQARFPGVLQADGAIDRAELGRRVFADPDQRQVLEAITHPAVAQEVSRRVGALRDSGCPLLFYDVPLLFERRLEGGMDGVIVVWVPAATQMARLMERDCITAEEARERIAAQLPLDAKKRRATWVIDNSESLERTREQVEELWRELNLRASPS